MTDSAIRIEAILFDMDGVLIDSNSVIERAWREAAEMYGKSISEEQMVKHIHGQPGPHTIQALFSDLPLTDQRKVQAHIIQVEDTAEYDPVPGVAQLIHSLNAAGVKVGIVTSGWREKIDRVIAMLNVQHCISVIVERDDVGRGKPFPDPYLLACLLPNVSHYPPKRQWCLKIREVVSLLQSRPGPGVSVSEVMNF